MTEHPTAEWIVQQLREAFAYDAAPHYLVFDKDTKYGAEVLIVIEHMVIRHKQNGVAKRWVETARRDLLDHVVALNERHLQRLVGEYVAYHPDDRTHLGPGKGTPSMRPAASKPNCDAEIVGCPRVGGPHDRYESRQAA